MAVIRYSSYPPANFQQEINRMFDEFDGAFERSEVQTSAGNLFRPPVDVREDNTAYTIQLEAPGVPQENLQISMQDNALTIRGHKEQNTQDKSGRFRRVERAYGTFSRTLNLPRDVDAAQISAHLSDGVLEVRLPKSEDARPRRIAIATTRDAAARAADESNDSKAA